jgi:hypothetical protein
MPSTKRRMIVEGHAESVCLAGASTGAIRPADDAVRHSAAPGRQRLKGLRGQSLAEAYDSLTGIGVIGSRP